MQLDRIVHKIKPDELTFFSNFQKSLGLQLYFIGSVTRCDYVSGSSDFDIDVFSNTLHESSLKLRQLLQKGPSGCFVFDIKDETYSGVKYFFKNDTLHFDITLYPESAKKNILESRYIDINLPLYGLIFVTILKWVYYKLGLMTSAFYTKLKRSYLTYFNPDKTVAVKMNYDEYNDFFSEGSNYKSALYMIHPSVLTI